MRISSRQYQMLRMFYDLNSGGLSIQDMKHYDQRPFRSMLIQGWVRYSPRSRSFSMTKEGRHALNDFMSQDISRKNPSLPLTSYFHMENL
jgi:hypothetical protein